MEVMAFNTCGVEYKLNDIMSALLVTNLAIAGLAYKNLINDEMYRDFEYILRDACTKTDALIKGLKPVLVENDKRIVLIYAEEAEAAPY